VVSGLELELNPISIVDQSITAGDIALTLVRVEGDGRFTAMVILRSADPYHELRLIPSQDQSLGQDGTASLKIIEFEGALQSISGNRWVIADRQVIVTPASSILGSFQLGGVVRVRAVVNAEGNLVALEIVRLSDEATDSSEELENRSPTSEQGTDEEEYPDDSSQESEDESDESDESEHESEGEEDEEDEEEDEEGDEKDDEH
jgi:hypothetical protein